MLQEVLELGYFVFLEESVINYPYLLERSGLITLEVKTSLFSFTSSLLLWDKFHEWR